MRSVDNAVVHVADPGVRKIMRSRNQMNKTAERAKKNDSTTKTTKQPKLKTLMLRRREKKVNPLRVLRVFARYSVM